MVIVTVIVISKFLFVYYNNIQYFIHSVNTNIISINNTKSNFLVYYILYSNTLLILLLHNYYMDI